MSHFCVLVIGDNPESQLERYDENLELPMHRVATKEELIKKERAWIEDYKNYTYAEFLKDPEAYKAHCQNEGHIKYLEETFPKMLEWTDEQCYEAEIKYYRESIEDGETWCEIHEDGSLWKTSNENAKWDWYQMGGRYRGRLLLKQPDNNHPLYDGWQFADVDKGEYERIRKEGRCDQALVGEISNLDELLTFAVVKNGEWFERGEMGWWAAVSNEKDKDVWESEVRELLKDLSDDTLLTVMDCHI
ncbi:MAG: hypothetical protein K6G25_06420 [Bacteroidales bacterium]|nr:hypothetical protein [Bacteroidales bacterium]